MQEHIKPLRMILNAAVTLEILNCVLSLTARFFPQRILTVYGVLFSNRQYESEDIAQVSAMLHHPMSILPLLIRLTVFLSLYMLVRKQIEKPTDFSGVLFGLTLAAMPVLSVIISIISRVTSIVLLRQRDCNPASFAAYSIVISAINLLGIVNILAFPLLIAAAGMNWYRYKTLLS